eukprot:COSAG01_NODE_2849_length_6977_cov_66.208200_8_plen_53_part_00
MWNERCIHLLQKSFPVQLLLLYSYSYRPYEESGERSYGCVDDSPGAAGLPAG